MAGRSQQIHYYRPYDSADESGSDSETSVSQDSWFSQGMDQEPPPVGVDPDGIPNFKAFATQVQLRDAAARDFSTIKDQIIYGKDKLGKYTVYSQYDAPTPDLSGEDRFGKTRFATSDGNGTNLIMVDSRYRDRTAYPQPTLFTLRLPRIYKNVTNVTLSDLKLLTSFYFFRPSKGNTDLTVYEKDRTTLTYEGTLQSTIVKKYITTGSYDINGLLNEIQLQLNYTPLFFDYPNGFNDFIGLFRASGDYSLNFNKPGDYFFNNTTNLWVPNPTIDTITLHFWTTRYAGLISYSVDQVSMAYYYPVLNEYLFDENFSNKDLNLEVGIGINPSVTTREQVIEHILYAFTGINPPDPIVLAVIQANKPQLDAYRLKHTFRYWLVNKYVVARDTRSQNVYITSPSLNTSLVTLLNSQYASLFNRAIQLNNLTARQYATLQSNVDRSLAVLQSMYSFEQTQFLNYFGVPWSQYTLSYYANLDYSILLRNGVNAVGIPSNDSEAVEAGIIPQSNDILNSQTTEPSYYWPNLSSVTYGGSLADTTYLLNLSTFGSTFNLIYDMNTSNFNDRQTIVQPPNDYLYSEYLTKSANVVCPIEPAKYTVFKFRSPVRQTMQVETLPRPTGYRVINYNLANYDSTINQYFDISYNYIFTSNSPYTSTRPGYEMAYDNLPIANLATIPGWGSNEALRTNSNYSWGRSLPSSISLWPINFNLDILKYNQSAYVTFTTPEYPTIEPQSSFTYSLSLRTSFHPNLYDTITLASPTAPMRLFFYHDRAAFQADVLSNRNENPRFYKQSTIITGPIGTIDFTTYPMQQYYIILRPDINSFGTAYPQFTPYFTSSFTITQQTLSIDGINPQTDVGKSNFDTLIQTNFNYAQVYDSNWIRLPIQSTLWTPDPAGASINQDIILSNVPIGYDDQGVSTDYTDYVPYGVNSPEYSFYPASNLGMDPIKQYQFQSNSPYNSTTNTYLYAGSLNAILKPGLSDLYTPGIVAYRQFKQVHYYSPTYIPESTSNYPLTGLIDPNQVAQQPYNINTTYNSSIGGYTYRTEASTIQLNKGVLGFSFIPNEGVWDLKRLVFRSAINDYANDPNQIIKYLAIYNMRTVLNIDTKQLNMSTAITVLSNSARVTYTSTFTLETGGFDTKGGTYYEFQKDPTFVPTTVLPILGYSQFPAQMSDQPESMYTCIAFDEYGNPQHIRALSGSAVPYPFYNNAIPATSYFDGTQSFYSNQGVVIPSTIGSISWPFVSSISSLFAPQPGTSETQSQYALSQPIGTTVIPYKRGVPITEDSGYLQPWTVTTTPTNVVGNVPSYILLQDTNFNIFNYIDLEKTLTLDTPTWQIAPDQVYPNTENTALVAIAANNTAYYFLGLSNTGTSNALRLKQFNPNQGVLYNYTLDGSFQVPTGGTVLGFTINDHEQMVIAYQNTTNITSFYYNLLASTNMTSVTLPGTSTATISMDPVMSTLYWMPLSDSKEGTSVYQWPIDSTFPGTPYSFQGPAIPTTFTGLAVNAATEVPTDYDRVWLISQTPGYENYVWFTSNWDTTTSIWEIERVSTAIVSENGVGQGITSIANGANGGLWLTASNQPKVWANRNSAPDLNGTIAGAWQIFYPWQKLEFQKIANSYNPIVDLTYLDYPEYPHASIFYYRDEAKFITDTKHKWGLESPNNFVVADTNLAGYYFNGYIFNVPLKKDIASTDYQYITVRGYTPTEKFETLLRFNLPNVYSFGYATQFNMFEEINLYSSNPLIFNPNYGTILSNFNQAFAQSNSFFGQGLLPNFDGSNVNSSNFQEFAQNYSTIYAGYQSNANLLAQINTSVNTGIQTYISTYLQYILPPSAITRTNFTDPILFSLLWKSGLLPQYQPLLEDWGLGYNLGYAKIDTPFSTYHRASSFYKILEDYIFLRLNPQYQLNRMDNTFKENFKITRDPTGQIQNFHGKLLLNNFNTFSQTFVFNNQPFNPPIGRLDQLYFQWVNIVGDQIDNNDCDWSATCVITESRSSATTGSTIPALPPMQPLRK
jgi:hypothetical protein